MLGQKHQLLVDTVQRLLRREAHTNIKRIFAKFSCPKGDSISVAFFSLGAKSILRIPPTY